jgi:hypothetical protein
MLKAVRVNVEYIWKLSRWTLSILFVADVEQKATVSNSEPSVFWNVKFLQLHNASPMNTIWARAFHILPPFQNIRCFSFVKQTYLDIF